jgi:two-component sensor histidine kinase
VHMQAASVTDPAARAALLDTNNRIRAIAQVHRRLYTSDQVETVEMDQYLAALVEELEGSWAGDGHRRLTLTADPVQLLTDKAVSLGVIVTELVTNACKYAYAPATPGEVRIQLNRQPAGHMHLVVEDDGPGFAGLPQGTGLGQKVVRAMATNLNTALTFDPNHKGVRAVLSFTA